MVLRGDLGRQKMHCFQAVREFRFTSELRCRLVEIGETATLQLDPLNQEQLKALGSLKQNAVPGTIVKLLAVTKDGPVEAQFLKEKLCGLSRRAVTPLPMRFTSRLFYPQDVFPRKPTEEPAQMDEPMEG